MSLRLVGVGKCYAESNWALREIDLEVEQGSRLALIGGSGSGKTTLLKLINRLLEPSVGQIFLEGQPIANADLYQHRRRFGYVVQRGGLFPHMSVEANICLPGRLLAWKKPALAERCRELLEMVELPYAEYAQRYPNQLSGGQQQRVGIARALFLNPPYLLLDEPLGALDPVTRRSLQQHILGLAQDKTLIVVTHDLEEAELLCQELAVLRTGCLLQRGTSEQLRSQPADDYVRQLYLR